LVGQSPSGLNQMHSTRSIPHAYGHWQSPAPPIFEGSRAIGTGTSGLRNAAILSGTEQGKGRS